MAPSRGTTQQLDRRRWVTVPKPYAALVAMLTPALGTTAARTAAARLYLVARPIAAKFHPDQLRDPIGRWTAEAGSMATRAAKWHTDLHGFDDLAHAVGSGAGRAGPLAYGRSGRSQAHLTDFGNHTQGVVTIYATNRHADADQLGSHLARSIGVPAPRTMRVEDDGAVGELVEGPTWAEREQQIMHDVRGYQSPGQERSHTSAAARQRADLARQRDEMLGSDAGVRAGLFDLLAGIDERDGGTVVMTPHGPVPVQHEAGWLYADGRNRAGEAATGRHSKANGSVAPAERRIGRNGDLSLWSAFSSHRSWKDNPLTPADASFLRARLDAARPQFEKLGRLRWWQFASDRLDAIAAHAHGTRDLFAGRS